MNKRVSSRLLKGDTFAVSVNDDANASEANGAKFRLLATLRLVTTDGLALSCPREFSRPASSSKFPLLAGINLVTKLNLRLASAIEALPPAQAPRTKRAHELIVALKFLVQDLERTPDRATVLVQEILNSCNSFLTPLATQVEDEIIDTQAWRDEIELMVKEGPAKLNIPRYPGGSAQEAKAFFQLHYGDKYNRPGCEVIFTPDLYLIDDKLLRALRFAYGGATRLPLGGREKRTEAINRRLFGDKEDVWRAEKAISLRRHRIAYGTKSNGSHSVKKQASS